MDTLAARYCAHHGLPAEKFERAVFWRALYPHARLLYPLIHLVAPDFFAADHRLVETLGRTTRLREFSSACVVYRQYLTLAHLTRRVLRLRVSVRRLYHLTAQTFDHAEPAAERSSLLASATRM